MKRIIVLSLLSCTAFTACSQSRERDRDQNAARNAGRFGYQGETETVVESVRTTPSQAEREAPSQPRTQPTPPPQVQPTPAPVRRSDSTYGTPIPGKPGFVTSPYAPDAGQVDVRGFPPGTEVRDPYTGKIFLVP
ncbi:MAG TPA: hypothetical protein VNQ90_06485 [Chthoniobacteraceae bacterium]|nr:hypothetical protein [Chthoniobacteraceae bacterium]